MWDENLHIENCWRCQWCTCAQLLCVFLLTVNSVSGSDAHCCCESPQLNVFSTCLEAEETTAEDGNNGKIMKSESRWPGSPGPSKINIIPPRDCSNNKNKQAGRAFHWVKSLWINQQNRSWNVKVPFFQESRTVVFGERVHPSRVVGNGTGPASGSCPSRPRNKQPSIFQERTRESFIRVWGRSPKVWTRNPPQREQLREMLRCRTGGSPVRHGSLSWRKGGGGALLADW